MKETARTEAIGYIKTSITPAADPSERIDKFLEYFAIMPIDLDPKDIIRKLDHVMRTKYERIRSEIKRMTEGMTEWQASRIENILEAATAQYDLQDREALLPDGKTDDYYVRTCTTANGNAISAFLKGLLIGDGIVPMVVGRMMLGKEKKLIARETVYSEDVRLRRKLDMLKALQGASGVLAKQFTDWLQN